MAYEVTRWSGLTEVVASCECGWESDARNALANAKRHAVAHGHVVTVNQQIGVTYGPRGLTKDETFRRVRYASWEGG